MSRVWEKRHDLKSLIPNARRRPIEFHKSLSHRLWTRFDVRLTVVFLIAWFTISLVVSSRSPSIPPGNFAQWINVYQSSRQVDVDCRKALIDLGIQTTSTDASPPHRELLRALPFSCSPGEPMESHTARDVLLTQLYDAPVTQPHEITHHKADEHGKISHSNFQNNDLLKVGKGPFVTVVVPFRNDALTLNASVYSLFAQTYAHMEIILVNDGSQDGSDEIADVLDKSDSRLKILRSPFPSGSGKFVSTNYGMVNGRGSLITFQNADDISHPARIEAQVRFLERFKDVMYVSPLFVRVSNNLLILNNDGVIQRKSLAASMFRRRMLNEIGYFDSVYSSADEEFYQRVAKVYGHKGCQQVVVRDRKHLTQVPLYYDFVSDTIAANEYQNGQSSSSTRNPSSSSYSKAFTEWHAKSIKSPPFVGFPMRKRPFDVLNSQRVRTQVSDQKVIASMATCRRRMDVLHETLDTLVSQVDTLYVYLNDFKQSELPASAKYPNVIYLDAPLGDIKDNGKIYPLELTEPYSFRSIYGDAYVFTVDDDILYPRDYVTRMILKIEEQKRQSIFGVHCVWLQKNQTRYYVGRRAQSFYRDLPENEDVHVLGTGTAAWHYSLLPHLNVKAFPVPGMADIWLAVEAVGRNIPLTCVAREHNWLKRVMTNNSIWNDHSAGGRTDRVQTQALKGLYPGYFTNSS